MKISIVVPVYNAEKHLEKTISSVLNQLCPNWELVLVNDGSTDNSGAICDDYSRKYDNILSFNKENEGQFLTRQFGIEKSSGDYIGFLDADDLLDEKYVQSLIDNIQQYDYPDVLCFGFVELRDNQRRKKVIGESKEYITDSSIVFNDILNNKITGSMCSKVFASGLIKELFVESAQVKSKRYGEDTYHSFSLLLNAKTVLYLDTPLYVYIRNNDGASVGFDKRCFDYFNTKYISNLLLDCSKNKHTNDNTTILKIYANNFNESVYYILRFYRSAGTFKRKKACVDYDWSTYLLEMTDEEIAENPYIRKSYIKVWNAFKKKRYLEIYIREKIKKIGWG